MNSNNKTNNPQEQEVQGQAAGSADRPPFVGMGKRFLRSMAAVVILAMTNTALAPLAKALELESSHRATSAQTAPISDEQLYATALQDLHNRIAGKVGNNFRTVLPADGGASVLALHAERLQKQWAELRSKWQSEGVDASVMERQLAVEGEFSKRHNQLMSLLLGATSVNATDVERQQLISFLDREASSPTHLPVNLQNMPWQVEKPTAEKPAESDAELQQKLTLRATGEQPSTMRALQAKSATSSTQADLASTIDAQQTAEIKALAASLDNNPHKIYQWVHDNIHYFPSHGSIQGAQDTLDKKRGNAFDTNSLLIALLRSAGIPARYVYGTVEIPVDQVQNWVGGAETADAAQQMLGQGGVPSTILTKAGKDYAFRMEHVWVEALIQYHPSRGAKHIAGQSEPDTWVPMDGSFKQYTFASGMDLQAAVPMDAQALINAANQGAEINEAEGWVRNINSAAVETQLKAYQNELQNYISKQNSGNSTVGDVLGIRSAQIDPLPYLAGTLPYTIKARGQQFSEVPANRRAQFKYEIYTDQRAAAWGDSSVLSWQIPTVSLAGKKVTLAWVAASAADQAAIEALIPKPAPGQELNPDQLPRGLSSSIYLKPEIRLDGVAVATGYGMKAGAEPVGRGGFTRYGNQTWDETTDQLIAGQQSALGISIQGVSGKQLETLKARMEQTKARLEQAQAAPQSQREAILQGMTGENLTGDMLTATMWGWFASVQSNGVIASSQAGTFDLPGLSYGLFHAQVKPNKLYGIVTTGITFKGLNMDIGHSRVLRWVKNDDPNAPVNNKPELTDNGKSAAQNRWIAYNKMRGQYASSMEHAVPEEFWVDKSQCRYTDSNGQILNPTMAACGEGISAVKAIAIAQQQGQKIYTINQSNRDTALPKLSLGGDAGAEIRSAIQAGKEVTFHERSINAHGWTGMGYIVVDPDTGGGAYLIEGGGNGAVLLILGAFIGMLIAEILIMTVVTAASGGLAVGVALILAMAAITMLIPLFLLASEIMEDATDAQKTCFIGGLLLGMSSATYSLSLVIPKILEKILFYLGIGGGIYFPSTTDYKSCINFK